MAVDLNKIAEWLIGAGYEPMTDLELSHGQQRRPLQRLALLVECLDSVIVVAGARTNTEIENAFSEVQVLCAAMLSAEVTKDLRLLIVGPAPALWPSHMLPPRIRIACMVDETNMAERLEELTASDPSVLADRTEPWIDEALPPATDVSELEADSILRGLYELLRGYVNDGRGDFLPNLKQGVTEVWSKLAEPVVGCAPDLMAERDLNDLARARVEEVVASLVGGHRDEDSAPRTETYRLTSLEAENCLGFNKRQTVPLDANVVLIFGRNGTGKSSVVEAIRLGLFGPQALASTLERGYYPPKTSVKDLAGEPLNRFSGKNVGQASVELMTDCDQAVTAGHRFIKDDGWTSLHPGLGLSYHLFASANCFSQELFRDLILEPRQRRYLRLLEVLNLSRAQSLCKALQYITALESPWSEKWVEEKRTSQHHSVRMRELVYELPFRVRGRVTAGTVRTAFLQWLSKLAPEVDWRACLGPSSDRESYRSLAQEVWKVLALADSALSAGDSRTTTAELAEHIKFGLERTKHVLKHMVRLKRRESPQLGTAAHDILMDSFKKLRKAWDKAMSRMVQERKDCLITTWHRLHRTLSPHGHFTDPDVRVDEAAVWLCATDTRVPGGEKPEMRVVLSAGQLNCAMISLLLAAYIHQESPLRTLILDDPFVSLDDVRIDIFTSLLRGLVGAGTQVVVGTYDRSIYNSLKFSLRGMKAVRPGRMLCLEIDEWSPTKGPVINVNEDDLRGGGDLSSIPDLSMRRYRGSADCPVLS